MSDYGAEAVTDNTIKADEERIRRENERRSDAEMERIEYEGSKAVFNLSEKERGMVEQLNAMEAGL